MNTIHQNKDKIVFLFGPTAVGKTALLTDVFSENFEVVNADSVQVYRFLDIGSAKANLKTRQRITHYLIDIKDPRENWSVKDFIEGADEAIKTIKQKGKEPVISGGTAFYIKSFIYGLSQAPHADPKIRAEVENFIRQEGKEKAYDYLKQIDPVSASRINISDLYRISRAIEVYKSSSKPLSSFTVPVSPRRSEQMLLIGLRCDKQLLSQRIRVRVDLMFKEGFTEEIEKLLSLGATLEWQSMQAIGYKEFITYLNQNSLNIKQLKADDIEKIKDLIVTASVHYAKRQMTFFNSFKNVNWFDSSDVATLKKQVRALLEGVI